jgi:hypothetical protein
MATARPNVVASASLCSKLARSGSEVTWPDKFEFDGAFLADDDRALGKM